MEINQSPSSCLDRKGKKTGSQLALNNICTTFHPNTREYTFYSEVHGSFSKVDYILGYKTNLENFRKITEMSSIPSDNNATKRKINIS